MQSFYPFFQKLIVLSLLPLTIISCGGSSESNDNTAEEVPITLNRERAVEVILQKYKQFAEDNSPSRGHPRAVEDDKWTLTTWDSWTDGFFPGILWQLTLVDSSIEEQAHRWTEALAGHATMSSHDLGFIINNSFGKGYRVTGNTDYLPVIETAANTLSSRFNSNVGATRSWDFGSYTFPVIIDNMMNLALFFDSAKILNSEPYYSQAITHAHTTLNNHIRGDGTSFHLVDFSPTTGDVVKKVTVQGYADDSTWARGQAWGIHGFVQSYIESGETDFLNAAEQLANYFIDNLPDDYIPYWDFNIDDINAPRDSSAAAIAASGLWMLANNSQDTALAEKFKTASLSIVDNLISAQYFNSDSNYPAALLHATGNKPGEKEVDTSLIYADYYLLEVLLMQLSYVDLPL